MGRRVYITAFAPDEGEPFSALLGRFGDSDVIAMLTPDGAGALYIDPAKFSEVFAGGLPAEQASVTETERPRESIQANAAQSRHQKPALA